MDTIKQHRDFLKAYRWDKFADEQTPQRKKEPVPPVQKPHPDDAELIDLVEPEDLQVGDAPLIDVIRSRMSHRAYTDESMTLEELSFLLWATQGIREVAENGKYTRRTVPSGGARHSPRAAGKRLGKAARPSVAHGLPSTGSFNPASFGN